MARLRTTRAVRVLTFEEKTRVANFFMLLIEVNFQTEVTNKRRSPQSTKNKKKQPASRKTKHPAFAKASAGRHAMQPCHMLCVNNATSRTCKFPVRDLFLHAFARILMEPCPRSS